MSERTIESMFERKQKKVQRTFYLAKKVEQKSADQLAFKNPENKVMPLTLPSASAAMTLPSADKLLLMFLASSSTAPSAPVLLTWEKQTMISLNRGGNSKQQFPLIEE